MEKEYSISTTDGGYRIMVETEDNISGIDINDAVFQEEMIGYTIVDTDTEIDNLLMWMNQTDSDSDKELMDIDRDTLKDIDDEYIFSSTEANEYVCKSINENAFNKICEDAINKHNELSK